MLFVSKALLCFLHRRVLSQAGCYQGDVCGLPPPKTVDLQEQYFPLCIVNEDLKACNINALHWEIWSGKQENPLTKNSSVWAGVLAASNCLMVPRIPVKSPWDSLTISKKTNSKLWFACLGIICTYEIRLIIAQTGSVMASTILMFHGFNHIISESLRS